MRNRILVLNILVVVCLFSVTGFADLARITGSISGVTVYRGQALVTRTIDVELSAGTSELIVEGLPNKIVPESLYAQTSGDVKVLSVRYREKAVKEDTRQEVKKLDLQIAGFKNSLYHTERKKQHFESQWSMFIKLRDFTADAAKADLNRGILTFEPIDKLTKLIQNQGDEYISQILVFEDEISDLKSKLEVLGRKRKELDAGRSRTERQAILFVKKNGSEKSFIELSYLVNGANWLPQYNLRADSAKSKVLVEYNAVVNQTSGEDWNGVSLSLSTAEPAMVAGAPVLEPMAVKLTDRVVCDQLLRNKKASESAMMSVENKLNFKDRSKEFKELLLNRRQQAQRGSKAQFQLRKIATSNQAFEFSVSQDELSEMQQQVAEVTRTEGVSVTYDLPGELSLPSRTDQQLVTISSVVLQAEFTLIATPLMTDYVYLQANLLNDSEAIFLPGPAAMFRNGEFVGRSDLPIVTIGENFTAGFGIDSQVQVRRELADKKTRVQGGNKIDIYHYRIALNNYKNSASQLRLLDRLPYTDDKSIKIELLETSPAMSVDGEYVRSLKKKGILRWDLDLEANSVEQDEMVVKYSYTMEYDKNMQIQPR